MTIRLIILFIPLVLFISCEEIPNETIVPEIVEYSIEEISAPNLVIFTESNTLSTSITINNSETIENVWFDVETQNGAEKISSSNKMLSESSSTRRIYSGEIQFNENLLPGEYTLIYYVQDLIKVDDENVRKVGSKKFQFLSEAQNFLPVISNLDLPTEIARNIQFRFSIFVEDQNGLNDIESVYYQLSDPGGNLITNSQGISKFPMFDDGATSTGDLIENDGVFTVYLTFPSSVGTGNWEFQFNAEDKAGAISNTIIQSMAIN